MQTTNANPPLRLTGRHVIITNAMKDYVRHKVASLHLDYPRIVEIHAILSIEKYRHSAEIILRCSNHITIKVTSETDDMYASLDQVVDRIARKMRKYHTRVMCKGLLRRHSVRTGPNELRA
jgi:putative sigma-54 modulation protein